MPLMLAVGGARGRGAAGQSSAHRSKAHNQQKWRLRVVASWIGSQLQKPPFLSRLTEEAIHWNSKELENSSGSGSWMRSDTAWRFV